MHFGCSMPIYRHPLWGEKAQDWDSGEVTLEGQKQGSWRLLSGRYVTGEFHSMTALVLRMTPGGRGYPPGTGQEQLRQIRQLAPRTQSKSGQSDSKSRTSL